MMERRVLEEYAEFLSPLRLPHTLKLFASDCGGSKWDSPYYTSTIHAINMCYSFFAAADKPTICSTSRQEANCGAGLARAIRRGFVYLGLDAWDGTRPLRPTRHSRVRTRGGRPDEVVAFLALQFNKETARTVIKGFAYMWAISGDPRTQAMDITDPK
jgi:hypothetical protein